MPFHASLHRLRPIVFIVTVLCLLILSLFYGSTRIVSAVDDHLFLCEAVVTPTTDEYIEVHHPHTASGTIDLTNYYLSDDEDYALLPGAFGAGPAPGIGSTDFIVQFPPGASIIPGQTIVVAFDGAAFLITFGFAADFEIIGTDAGTPDMLATNVGATRGLTNSGEHVVLFMWDGASDLVVDVDMANIGTPSTSNDIGDKTSVTVDGPDAGAITSSYVADAFTMPQMGSDPGFGFSAKRILPETVNETTGGGNGITGDDETTETITTTWTTGTGGVAFTVPDPGSCINSTTAVTLQGIDAEIPVLPFTLLLVLVLFATISLLMIKRNNAPKALNIK